MYGSFKHVQSEDRDQLSVQLLSDEAYKTSEIEGELLNRESIQSSIQRHFGLKTEDQKVSLAEQGVAEVMVDIYKTFDAPLTHSQLFDWHNRLTKGRRDLMDRGRYRTHSEPMQIVSNTLYNPKVHFEAPPSNKVREEMKAFIHWFNWTAKGCPGELSALVRSGIAHLYFESIHPFEDGNGRIGRAIAEKALSQHLGYPTLIALARQMEQNRKEYYAALQSNSFDLEITNWLVFFSESVLSAQRYTQSMIDFLIEKGKFYERFEEKLNMRQKKVIKRMFSEGIEGFKGGLSAKNYMSITGVSRATTTRDLQALWEIGAFRRQGELRYTRYYLNIDHDSAKPTS
jgi:Fic family protein